MTRTIVRERIPSTDPRLKRHVNHDSRSRGYAFDTSGLSIVSAKHTRRIPVLDQGNLGSCTGHAGIGCMGTEPYYGSVGSVYTYGLSEAGAVQLYSDATRIDEWPGEYPPEDTGSSGLAVAKALLAAGEISGYRWTFNLDDALKALGVTPYITGTLWYSDMYYPDASGRVRPTGSIAGGHEYEADEIDAEREQVWYTNSWGEWGTNRDGRTGRFWMSFADYGTLLARQGDVTVFTPLTEPAPVPPPDPDQLFASALRPWAYQRHVCGNAKTAKAAQTWLTAKGL